LTGSLQQRIDAIFELGASARRDDARELVGELRRALSAGEARAAEPDPSAPHGWRVNTWVKRGILLAFRFGETEDVSVERGRWPFFDKDTLPLKQFAGTGVRIVPGGSSIRDGAYIADGVICMPPMYINIGAYVGAESLIDTHALVGSCAQVGRRVHVSAAAQLGGVLEPVGALPVIVEDDVLIGGNCGVYEGAVIKSRAVLASGTILTASTPIYDVTAGTIIQAAPGEPLVVPEGAVVVPGARPIQSGHGKDWQLSVSTPIIVKYRDDKTSAKTALEEWIR
jgi:2,3,4,5-tetrahydropyridine-2,6-dicarboxylate N-succinyltransferase